ncbi:MAG: NmrA family NAD(P)-binding protein [Caulobacter sp.]|nr:NmrA family NAD(P)-binding protein [Caulobacter sp.]
MILVIGGTGRIGSRVVQQLADLRLPVRVLARRPEAARALAGPTVEVAAGDLDQPGSLPAAFAGVSSVFLLTTQSPRQEAQERAAIAAARAAGVSHVVKVSAGDAATAPNSPTPVGRAHAAAEAALKASGLSWTILRPSAFMQVALEPLLEGARDSGRLLLPLGAAKVAFIDVDDIARAAVWALTHPAPASDRTLVLTGPEALGLQELAPLVSRAVGRPVKAVSPPMLLVRMIIGRRIADPFLRRHQLALLGLMRAGRLAAVSPDLALTTGQAGRSVADWLADRS